MNRMNKIISILFVAYLFFGSPLNVFAQDNSNGNSSKDRLSITYSSETFFEEEFKRAYKGYKNGLSLFWVGIGITAATSIVGSIASSLVSTDILDENTGHVLAISSFAVTGISTIVTIAGATAWWNGNSRLMSLIETREKFFSAR